MKVNSNQAVSFQSNLIKDMIKQGNNFQPVAVNNPIKTEAADNYQQAQAEILPEIAAEKEIQQFQEALKSRKWKKTYLPESDVIWVSRKHSKNNVEYCIEKDGTVKKTTEGEKSEIIMDANRKISEKFNDIKAKKTGTKKSVFYRIKDGIADTWKFFSAAGTMIGATVKGLFYGALTSAGVVAGATILNTPKVIKEGKSVFQALRHPLETAGKAGKIYAVLAGVAVLAAKVVAGKLRANQKTAVVEHKMKVDHRNK